MDAITTELCPRCNVYFFTRGQEMQSDGPLPPALSRADNETYICSECGTDEAMTQFAASRKGESQELPGPDKWPLDVAWAER